MSASAPDDGTAPGRVVRPYRPEDAPGIRAVMEASLVADRIPGFTALDLERAIERLPADPDGTAVAEVDGVIVGYATPRSDDLTVHPSHRRQGHGRALVPAALAIERRAGHRSLLLHVAADLPASQAFARELGFTYHSSLWLFELPAGVAVDPPRFPAGYASRALRPADDLERYVGLMNATFADHPTPISWTVGIVRHVHGLPGFDHDGVRLVTVAGRPDALVGFSRAEVLHEADGPVGLVNQIGVLPAHRGRGLGRELLRWGITYLRGLGAGPIQLAVEAQNDRALELYRRHGFEPRVEWPHWALPVPPEDGRTGPGSTAGTAAGAPGQAPSTVVSGGSRSSAPR